VVHRLVPSPVQLFYCSTALFFISAVAEIKNRGDWRSFEPSPCLITPITSLFDGPIEGEPFVVTVERILRLLA